MDPFFSAYLDRLRTLHAELDAALAELPPAALDWSPAADVNSMIAIAAHVAGSQRYWIGEVIGQIPAHRNRAAEFQARGVAADALRAGLAAAREQSEAVLARLTLADLGEPRLAPHKGETYSVAWVLGHVLEHTALHVGHVQLMRQWWAQAHQ